jgi:hypothetical protein
LIFRIQIIETIARRIQKTIQFQFLFSFQHESDGGLADYVTDEELELCQTIQPMTSKGVTSYNETSKDSFNETSNDRASFDETLANELSKSVGELDIVDTDNFEVPKTESSPHKEVLIGGDNNPSRRFLYFC